MSIPAVNKKGIIIWIVCLFFIAITELLPVVLSLPQDTHTKDTMFTTTLIIIGYLFGVSMLLSWGVIIKAYCQKIGFYAFGIMMLISGIWYIMKIDKNILFRISTFLLVVIALLSFIKSIQLKEHEAAIEGKKSNEPQNPSSGDAIPNSETPKDTGAETNPFNIPSTKKP